MPDTIHKKREEIKHDKARIRTSRGRVAMQRRQLRHALAVKKRREAELERDKRELQALIDANHGAAKGVAWGLEQAHIGRVEEPPFSNDSSWMRKEFTQFGFHPSYAWCQYMADSILLHGGGPVVPTGYTVAGVQWAREGKYGLRLVSKTDIQMGDWYYMKWPGVSRDFCDHVATAINPEKGLEGNTSPGTSGSQNNGGGLYVRTIAERRPYIVAVVRPTYSR